MKKLDKVIDLYNRMLDLNARSEEAEKETFNPAYMAAIRKITAGYASLLKEKMAQGKEFGFMFRLYSEMRFRENSWIDIYDLESDPAVLIRIFQDFGVNEFTYSCNYADAQKTLWRFVESGCKIVGMVKINSSLHIPWTNAYEKIPAFLLAVPDK